MDFSLNNRWQVLQCDSRLPRERQSPDPLEFIAGTPNGRLIVDLVPELKLIIGDQPPVPELPPQEAQGRFQLVFRRFINVFAQPEHPLALFLDDLQWLDAATLDLLEVLLTQPDVHHLMLIGADSVHPTRQQSLPRPVLVKCPTRGSA